MKYTCSVCIDQSIHRVVELWNDESYFDQRQDGFKSILHLEGTPHAPGAKSKIYFHQGSRKIELLETMLVNNLPVEKTALYEHVHMTNTQTTRFESISSQQTKYTSEIEYLKFNGFMIKIIARLFPSTFKKQSLKWMEQFKAMVESGDL